VGESDARHQCVPPRYVCLSVGRLSLVLFLRGIPLELADKSFGVYMLVKIGLAMQLLAGSVVVFAVFLYFLNERF
jgi:hypothetical protein